MILFSIWVLLVMPAKEGVTAKDEVRVENVYFESQADCDAFWKARSSDLIDIAHAHRHGLSFGDHRPIPHASAGTTATYTCIEKDKP